MNYRLFGIGLLVGLSLACTRTETDVPMTGRDTFYASLEQPAGVETRVYADENLMLLWHADDRVSIFDRYTFNQEYRFTGETGDNAGSFEKVPNGEFNVGNEIPCVYAVYPFQSSTSLSNEGVLTVVLPSNQTYAARSFGHGSNTMVSSTDDNNLLFKNVGGYLVLKLYGEGAVSSITLKGNGGEPLAGKVEVTAPVGGTPTLRFLPGEALREVTLTCPEPMALSASEEEYTEFWFVLPPVTFEEGFSVTVTGPAGDSIEQSTEKTVSVERNNLIRMAPFEVSLSSYEQSMSTVSDVQQMEDGTKALVQGLVSAVSTRAFILSDEGGHILVYTGPGAMTYSLGDEVRVSGTKETYRGVAEISNRDLSVSVESSGNELPALDYLDITDSFDGYSEDIAVPICFRGTLTHSGYYYVSVVGAARTGCLYWPVEGSVDSHLLGSTVLVKGFYQGRYSYSSGALMGDYMDIVFTSIEDADWADQPDNEIWYTTTDGQALDLTWPSNATPRLLSNSYSTGKGVLVFDDVVSTLPNDVFSGQGTLREIWLPESVEKISSLCFLSCSNLVRVSFSGPLKAGSIRNNPFVDCPRLSEFVGPNASSDGRCLIVDGVMVAFAPGGLSTYRIPSQEVSSFGNSVFTGLQGMEIHVPSQVELTEDSVSGFYSGRRYDAPSQCRFFVEGEMESYLVYRLFFVLSFESDSDLEVDSILGIGQFFEDVMSGIEVIHHRCELLKEEEDPSLIEYHLREIDYYYQFLFRSPMRWSEEDILANPDEFYNEVYYIISEALDAFLDRYAVTSVGLDKTYLEMIAETTGSLNASVEFRSDSFTLDMEWDTSDPAVVCVNDTGILWAQGPGTAVITVSVGNKSATCTVRVTAPDDLGSGWVDLGLGVKWATGNLGATWSGSRGIPFAWGETSTKSSFTQGNYKWFDAGDSGRLLKYNTLDTYGPVDNLVTLLPEDDPATVMLGNGWRTPTLEEFQMLVDQCDWTWTERHGINGYLVTSRVNENSLFLPATVNSGNNWGYLDYGSNRNVGQYWSASVFPADPRHAQAPYFSSGTKRPVNINFRNLGRYIRPVKD